MLTCGIKDITGHDCPGCGFQRAFIYLLEGDIQNSFLMYPPLFFEIALVCYTALHLIFKLRKGALYIKLLFIACILVIVINYLYKLANGLC